MASEVPKAGVPHKRSQDTFLLSTTAWHDSLLSAGTAAMDKLKDIVCVVSNSNVCVCVCLCVCVCCACVSS